MTDLAPELARDLLNDGHRRFETCEQCNHDGHACPGCGEPLSHNGMEKAEADVWRDHLGCVND